MKPPELALALVGFGNVGRRFVRLLDEVADRLDFTWRLVAIAHAASRQRRRSPTASTRTRAATIVESSHRSIGSIPRPTSAAASTSSAR